MRGGARALGAGRGRSAARVASGRREGAPGNLEHGGGPTRANRKSFQAPLAPQKRTQTPQAAAIGALRNLAVNDDLQHQLLEAGAVPALLAVVTGALEPAARTAAVEAIRRAPLGGCAPVPLAPLRVQFPPAQPPCAKNTS